MDGFAVLKTETTCEFIEEKGSWTVLITEIFQNIVKEERKVSFAQAVDNLVLFCQQQDLSVDIQLYSQLKQLRKRIVGKSIAAKKQTCLEDFINFEIQ